MREVYKLRKRVQISHNHTFFSQSARAFLRAGLLIVQLQCHCSTFVHTEQCLKHFRYVGIVFSWSLHETAPPSACLVLSVGRWHLSAVTFIAFVSHQHQWDVFHVSFNLADHVEYWPEFFEALLRGDWVDEYERVTLRNGESLHGRKLMTSGGVCDLQSANVLVWADHLTVCIFNSRNVSIPKRAFHKSQH